LIKSLIIIFRITIRNKFERENTSLSLRKSEDLKEKEILSELDKLINEIKDNN
jgi:hypothetical protein